MRSGFLIRFFAHPLAIGLSSSTVLHAAAAGVIVYLLLAVSWPADWQINVRRGEVVMLQAQLATVASAMPEQMTDVEISVERTPLEPPPPATVDHAPVRETLAAVPVVLPVTRTGEYEPLDPPPQPRPPETPRRMATEHEIQPREQKTQEPTPERAELASKAPPRQVADELVIAQSNIAVAALGPAEAGAQVDELPKLMPLNREPYYPLEALRLGREGRVVLLVLITSQGRAAKISVSQSSGTPSLDESAVAAVREWQFSPARRNGVAVLHEALVPVNFRIR